MGSFRIRQYFLGLDPAAVPFFPPTGPEGVTKLERIGVLTGGPLQLLLTAASMVACINAIVGGVTMALAVRWLLDASVSAAAVGTELLRDATRPGRYLVIDRWGSADAAARFLAERGEEYQRRSRDTTQLYLREVRLGAFDAVAAD